ncbi:unnamed protein product [Microthlaspi erraticum]|uniref:Uncharacterized protein n=1 Tax=Microthlaspi erraticum TaxID=1685480 RepID=A0A6D2L2T2_9BRAS|nr:unnamed protein product [Microthlaspi erraticum]
MASKPTSSSSSPPGKLRLSSLSDIVSRFLLTLFLDQEVADETQDWVLGAGLGWVEARTSCKHLNSLSPDLVELPTPDTPCSRFGLSITLTLLI